MEYKKEVCFKNYFDIHDYYTKIYGDKTIILMQIGSFHECYCTNNRGIDLTKLSEEIDAVQSMKNNNKPLSESNPKMMGFPIYIIDNFIEKLVNINYTVVVIDQVTEPPNPKRKVTGIYSPSTFIQKTNSSASTINLVSIYIDFIKKSENTYCIGVASYDLTTGTGSFYETPSKLEDPMKALDEVVRYLENNPPKEVIFYFNKELDKKINNLSEEDIKNYLNISSLKIFSNDEYLKILSKISYQEELFNSVYNHKSNVNIFSYIDISYYNFARIALTSLLFFAKNHQANIIDKLKKPILFNSEKYLFLGNRSIDQLDVISDDKPFSLFKIINNTRTIIGKRLLRDNLVKPIFNIDELNYRYNLIENINDYNCSKIIYDKLNNIYDTEKLARKLSLKKLYPNELYNLYCSYKQVQNLISDLDNYNLIKDMLNIDSKYLKKNSKFLKYIEETFDINQLCKVNFVNYKEEEVSFFNKNIYDELDETLHKINVGSKFMDYFRKELENHIDDKVIFKKKDANTINIKYNDRDGHYLMLTKRRAKILEKGLSKMKILKIENLASIPISDLEFTDLPKSNNTKINYNGLKDISNNIVKYKQQLASKLKEFFYLELEKINEKYSKCFNYWNNKIAFIDFINSGAITANNLAYCKPELIEDEKSYFEADQLRHPIVEMINENSEYCPHNINLGNDINGILLYGINSSGKSTLMKSIGLNIILAQIGYFVSATEFKLSPYKSLFSRISGNDNIFRGLSSFMVEMVELMAILKRNNKNTLVIGDEICRGTEEKSANIIVAYMLEKLNNNNVSFITATHLHQIANMPSVRSIEKVKPMHLKVEYDNENDRLIYSRELLDGPGDNFYGVQVAKYLMKDDHFNNRTRELENEFDDVKLKASNYNKDSWMEQCYICKSKKKLETHHINWQKDCDDKVVFSKPHIKKNKKYNLLTVCTTCHDKIDRDEIVVKGWKNTSDGLILNYFIKDKKKSKYSQDEILIIKKYINLDPKEAKKKLLDNHNINISITKFNNFKKDNIC